MQNKNNHSFTEKWSSLGATINFRIIEWDAYHITYEAQYYNLFTQISVGKSLNIDGSAQIIKFREEV